MSERKQIVAAIVEGNSIRSTCRMTGRSKGAVLKLLAELGEACSEYHDIAVRNVKAKRVQADEIWSFCYAKKKNVPKAKENVLGIGDLWTWTAIEAQSKLIISYACGKRDADWAKAFIDDLASRCSTRLQITTDGLRFYADAIEGAFGAEVDYSVLIKLYGAPMQEDASARYSPAKCIGTTCSTKSGNPDPEHISTSYVERQNLTMRMSMRRFTRLTNGFSKKYENHCHMLAIYFLYYNFGRVHQTLRVTPAMEAGLCDHVWTIEDICSLAAPKTVSSARAREREMVSKALAAI
jgi:IS1 family transposase